MAVWARQRNGLFASGLRLVWEFLRDEAQAWRTSLNAIVDAQMPAGQAFGNGYLGHSANASEARWTMHHAPVRVLGTTDAFDVGGGVSVVDPGTHFSGRRLLPIGALRCPSAVDIRSVIIALASSETAVFPFAPMIVRRMTAGMSPGDPVSIPPVTFSLRHIIRAKADTFRTGGQEDGGELFDTRAAEIVSESVVVCTRIDEAFVGVGGVGTSAARSRMLLGDVTTEGREVALLKSSFAAGDVLVGVLEVPQLTLPTYVSTLMGLVSVRIEYARRHA